MNTVQGHQWSVFFFIANFHSRPELETKISTDFTTYTVAFLQRFFHWRTQRTFGIAFKRCRLLVTIIFCLIMFRSFLYNMHFHISWCYKSSFLNISCQFFWVCVCVRFCFLFFCRSRFLLLSKLACCYLQLVMYR